MKKILKSKSGIAIETALLFMIVVFSLCALITSLAVIGRHQTRLENKTLISEVEIDQIGEDFLAYLRDNTVDYTNEKYDCTLTGTGNVSTLTVTKKNSTDTVLYIEAEIDGETVTLLRWRYN